MRLGYAIVSIGLLALSGCNPLAEFAPTQQELLTRDWMPPQEQTALTTGTCYRTLARVDCTSDPIPGQEARAVGFFDAPLEP